MKIFVFARADGTHGADYSEEFAKRNGKVVKTHSLVTRRDMESLVEDGGDYAPARVSALAERALKEFMARNQQPEPIVTPSPSMVTLRDRKFFGRLRWLLTGR